MLQSRTVHCDLIDCQALSSRCFDFVLHDHDNTIPMVPICNILGQRSVNCELYDRLSAVISIFKAYPLFLCVHSVIMASGALWLQFRPLILHLYQTPGGKQENRHVGPNLSLRFIPCASLCVLLWSLTNRINAINRPLRLSIRLLSICPFHRARAAPLKSLSKRLSTSALVQRTSYYRPALYQICATEPRSSDVPHSGTLLCFDSHIVPMSYGSNQACPVYA